MTEEDEEAPDNGYRRIMRIDHTDKEKHLLVSHQLAQAAIGDETADGEPHDSDDEQRSDTTELDPPKMPKSAKTAAPIFGEVPNDEPEHELEP